jgi:hypothetical protein
MRSTYQNDRGMAIAYVLFDFTDVQSVNALRKASKQIMKELFQNYIILDSLDDWASCSDLTEMLETITKWQLQSLRFLVTSQREQKMLQPRAKIIEYRNTTNLQMSSLYEDKNLYIQQKLYNTQALRAWVADVSAIQVTEDILITGLNIMYLRSHKL